MTHDDQGEADNEMLKRRDDALARATEVYVREWLDMKSREESARTDDLDAGVQPRCPVCGVLMHTVDHGDECPSCGRRDEWPELPSKPLDDDTIIDFPATRP